MGRLTRGFRWLLQRLADTRGVSLYETTAVVAMSAVLASVAVPMAMDRVENAKSTKAAQEILTLSAAMQKFFEHTGRWPGETEIRRAGSSICFLQTGVPATDSSKGAVLPEITSLSLPTLPMDASSFLGRTCNTITADNVLNINNYVVRKPSETDYANWQGPYMEPIAADPWDRAYIINVLPLFFATRVDDPGLGKFSETGGKIGFGWVLTGGPDRLLQTALTSAQLASTSDDTGKNLGARILKSTGGGTGGK
jgi:type II secretory pathway pseudopilin PulG